MCSCPRVCGCVPRVGVGGSACWASLVRPPHVLAPQAGCCQWVENNCILRSVGCFWGGAVPGRGDGDYNKSFLSARSILGVLLRSFCPWQLAGMSCLLENVVALFLHQHVLYLCHSKPTIVSLVICYSVHPNFVPLGWATVVFGAFLMLKLEAEVA